MQVLIDGYNLMHARGFVERRQGRDGFRKARELFLDELALALGPLLVRETLVVFDAAGAPPDVPEREIRKGLSVEYAVHVSEADALLEDLIRRHDRPRTLTVVSTDRRIRDAARRRGAVSLTCDEFLDRLESKRPSLAPGPTALTDTDRPETSKDETDYWLSVFGNLEIDTTTRVALKPADFIPTDAEIERIRREVEDEP